MSTNMRAREEWFCVKVKAVKANCVDEKSVADIRHILGGRLRNRYRNPARSIKYATGYMKHKFSDGFIIERIRELLQERQAFISFGKCYFVNKIITKYEFRQGIEGQYYRLHNAPDEPLIRRQLTALKRPLRCKNRTESNRHYILPLSGAIHNLAQIQLNMI